MKKFLNIVSCWENENQNSNEILLHRLAKLQKTDTQMLGRLWSNHNYHTLLWEYKIQQALRENVWPFLVKLYILYKLALAATIKYHRLGDLNIRHLFCLSLDVHDQGASKSGSHECAPLVCGWPPSRSVPTELRETGSVSPPLLIRTPALSN